MLLFVSTRSHLVAHKQFNQWMMFVHQKRRRLMGGRRQASQNSITNQRPTVSSMPNEPSLHHHHGEQQPSNWELCWLLLQRGLIAAGLVHCVTEYGADITLCEGPSMLNTFQLCGDLILVEKISLSLFGIHDGESSFGRTQAARMRQDEFPVRGVWHQVMLEEPPAQLFSYQLAFQQFWSPISVGDVVVADHPQRPGSICKRVVGLPGDQIVERRTGRINRVPDGHVWLEGDNPLRSKDSRHYGPIPIALLKGRVIVRIWPLRGKAWIHRQHTLSTVLPAGFRGEHIAKSQSELERLVGSTDP